MIMRTLITVLLFCAGNAFAVFSAKDEATYGAQFLKFGPSAKAAAMGEAFICLSEDSSALYWNPAGLVYGSTRQISVTNAQMFEDMSHNWLVYSFKKADIGLGFGLQRISYGEIAERDLSGNKTGEMSPGDTVLTAGAAKKNIFFENTDIGLAVKGIYSKIDKSAYSIAMDAGLKYRFNSDFRFALVVNNLGPGLKYEGESDPLPLAFKGGLAWSKYDFSAEADLAAFCDSTPFLNVGGKYEKNFSSSFAASVMTGFSSANRGGSLPFSFGFGLNYKNYGFDYAYSPYGDIGAISRVSFSVSF